MKVRTTILFVMGVSLLSGCQNLLTKPNKPSSLLANNSIIAQDFFGTMTQIDKLKPRTTTLDFGPALSDDGTEAVSDRDFAFDRSLRTQAARMGYAIRVLDKNTGPQSVQFYITSTIDRVGRAIDVYDVSVGDVEFRRQYLKADSGRLIPYQPMMVKGADISHVEPDDSIFELMKGTGVSTLNSQLPANFNSVRKSNMADIGGSNYENLLRQRSDVTEQVLIFNDDSYVLGAYNKRLLGKVLQKFNPETDVVSVIGCSAGVTKIKNGNAALAIGRANRVKEALLVKGVANDKIYEEGCWTDGAHTNPLLPSRGVLVTVKR